LERAGTVNIAVVREHGEYEVTWINAQDTADTRPAGVTSDGRGLTSPADGDDWLVHLVARKAPWLE
jgi:hypothetical protein